MDGFLIFILIVVALYYIGKWYIRRKIRNFFGQFNQQQNPNSQSQQSKRSNKKHDKSDSTTNPDKKKIFTSDEGEYVEFEEIKD